MEEAKIASGRSREDALKALKEEQKELREKFLQKRQNQELRTSSKLLKLKIKPGHKGKKKKSKSRREDRKSEPKSKKKRSKQKSRRKDTSSSSGSCSDSQSSRSSRDSSSEESDPTTEEEEVWREVAVKTDSLKRENWMTGDNDFRLKTFSRDKKEVKRKEDSARPEIYDPTRSTRELNPYWKSTGTGLPPNRGFQPPQADSDEDEDISKVAKGMFSKARTETTTSRGWKRKTSPDREREMTSEDDGYAISKMVAKEEEIFLNDQQMNELGAKIIKAEIMGNKALAAELQQKLDRARETRHSNKMRRDGRENEEHILLTHTDSKGQSRPLPVQSRDFTAGHEHARNRKGRHRVKTHAEGQRMRYFPDDDDRYDLKRMFEKEKYKNSADDDEQFVKVVAKSKGNLEDWDEIFMENISTKKDGETERAERRQMDRACQEQKRLEKTLDNCNRCLDSTRMQRELLVTVAKEIYLALPWTMGFQVGHCLLTSRQHISCCTQLDEDAWAELTDFRRALVKMFAHQGKDVIFIEMAKKLHRRPHLTVHCIPISFEKAEAVPFCFKKAIEESEYEWCVNKQLISLKQKSLLDSIPKGLPYFWVHFGMDTGFAHVIEDEERFPDHFAFEIIGGILELDARRWLRPQKEQNIRAKVNLFADLWRKFDITKQ